MSRLPRETCSLGPLPLVEISHPLIVEGTISEGGEAIEEGADSGEVGGGEEGETELTGEEGEDMVVLVQVVCVYVTSLFSTLLHGSGFPLFSSSLTNLASVLYTIVTVFSSVDAEATMFYFSLSLTAVVGHFRGRGRVTAIAGGLGGTSLLLTPL